jgi:hypothetical protein
VSCNLVFFCCCKLAILENAKSDYVTKNLKNVLKYIFQSQVDCCLPAHEPAAAAAAAAARQPTSTSEAEERRAD